MSNKSDSEKNVQPVSTLTDSDVVVERRYGRRSALQALGGVAAGAAAAAVLAAPLSAEAKATDSDPNDAAGHGRTGVSDRDPNDRVGHGRTYYRGGYRPGVHTTDSDPNDAAGRGRTGRTDSDPNDAGGHGRH